MTLALNGRRVRNALLAAMPDDDFVALEPHLSRVRVERGSVLMPAGASMPYVYFPLNCVVSTLVSLESGELIESATIGREGLVGVSVFLGAPTSGLETIGQVPGEALRLDSRVFARHLERSPRLYRMVSRYSEALFELTAQSVACNRVHAVEQRCARWLLMTQDRVDSPEIHLTQEYLAAMIGVRRPSVTVAAGTLQDSGLISYRRGAITILDRPGLEQAACECYGVIRVRFAELLGEAVSRYH